MRSTFLFLFTCIFLLASCQDAGKKHLSKGMVYTGDFAGDPIELSIVTLDDSTISGESLHLGVHADMSGKRAASQKGYTYVMQEIGSGRFDGIFEFELDTAINIIFGSWRSLDSGSRNGVLYTLRPVSDQ